MLPRKIIALLNPDEDKPQFIRSTTFIDGLNQAGDVFSRRFRVTKPGLKRAHWAEDQEQLKQKMVRLTGSNYAVSMMASDKLTGVYHGRWRNVFLQGRLSIPSQNPTGISRLWSPAVLCLAAIRCCRGEACLLSPTATIFRNCQGSDTL